MGVWTSRDAAGQFYNAYGYGNDPVLMVDEDGNFFFVPLLIGAAIGAYSGYKLGKASGAEGWGMAGYILGGAAIGGISGVAGAAISGAGFAGASTLGIASSSTINSAGMYALSGGRTDLSTSFGAFSVNWSKGDVGYLGKSGNSGLENFGYAMGAFSNIRDLGQRGNVQLQTEEGSFGHSAVTSEKGESIIDFGPDRTQGKLAEIVHNPNGASSWYTKVSTGASATNRFGFEGATSTTISNVNVSTLGAYGKFLDFMTTKGLFGIKMPYSFMYSSCSSQAGLGLLLSGVPNVGISPGLLEQSAQLWNAGVTPALITNSYHLQY